MAKKIVGTRPNESYSFSPGAGGSGTIVMTVPSGLTIENILLINNLTQGVQIYNPFGTSKNSAGFDVLGKDQYRLTLEFDTSSHSSSDKLQIWYDNSEDLAVMVSNLAESTKWMVNNISKPVYLDSTTGTMKVSGNIGFSTTPTVSAQITTISGVDPRTALFDTLMEECYNQLIRTRIT